MVLERQRNVLSGPELQRSYDMVIIGSGPPAISLAGVVADRFPLMKVLMLEQKGRLGGDGHNSQQQTRTYQDTQVQADLVHRTNKWYETFSTLVNLPYLFTARKKSDLDRLGQHLQRVREWGYGRDAEIIGADELRRRFPFIDKRGTIGAMFYPEAGQLDFNLAIDVVTRKARNTTFALDTAMGEIIVDKNKVTGIKIRRGDTVNCTNVVLAPGPFILKMPGQIIGGDLGLDGSISNYFSVQRRQTFSADISGLPPNTNIFLIAPGTAYVRLQTAANGAGVGQYGFAAPTEPIVAEPLLEPLPDMELFPYQIYAQLATIMSGYDRSLARKPKFPKSGYYADPLRGHLPVISRTVIEGLSIMAGFSHAGVMMAQGAAEKMAGIIFDGKSNDEFSLYRLPPNVNEEGFLL